jgi:glyoxylase I family protein
MMMMINYNDSYPVAPRTGYGRMHHIAYVAKDLGATCRFYEDMIGLPLIATWAEAREFPEFPGRVLDYCHVFFGLEDGSAMAFFGFADEDAFEIFYRGQTPFVHAAVSVSSEMQAQVKARIEAAGIEHFIIDHGYCRSLYVKDPDGLAFELTVDPKNSDAISAWQGKTARATLDRWLSGDRAPNNEFVQDHRVLAT